MSEPASGSAQPQTAAGGHAFSVVPTQSCVGCHAQSLHEPVTTRDGKIATTVGQSASFPSQGPDLAAASQHPDLAASGQAADLTGSGQAPNLTARLLATEKENDSLQTWVLVMLGLGLGAGTALGVLVAAVFINVRGSREVPS